MTGATAVFAELVAATNFSFLTGASHAHEMVGQAADLGLAAIGIADRNTLAGVVRAHVAAKEAGIKLLVGARLVTTDGFEVVCYPQDRKAYGQLSRLLTLGNRRAVKGECHITLADILAHGEGQIFIAMPPRTLTPAFAESLATLAAGVCGPARTTVASTPKQRAPSVVALPTKPGIPRPHDPAFSTVDATGQDPGQARQARLPGPQGEREAPCSGAPAERRSSAAATSASASAPTFRFAFPDAARERGEPGSCPSQKEHEEEKFPALAALGRDRTTERETPYFVVERNAPCSTTPTEREEAFEAATNSAPFLSLLPSRTSRASAMSRDPSPSHGSSIAQNPGRPGGERRGTGNGSRNVFLAITLAYDGREKQRLAALTELAERCGAPLVATTDALFHHPSRKPLADILTCIKEKCSIAQAGYRLAANAERHLKPAVEMARLYARIPDAVTRSLEIAGRVNFSLDELRYEYPDEPCPPGVSPQAYLEELTRTHAKARYPDGVPAKVQALIDKELSLIAQLDYARYFLTVYDVVRFARSRGILCQGRGSAANSAVCYCIGITSVDPTQIDLLFERFISADRGEPPDIDVDFEHERREEVIQYLYQRYGRERAAICATVIHYRPRMAIREVGKALGLTEDVTSALSGLVWGYGDGAFPEEHVREAGLDPDNPELRQALALANMLLGFPRHLSQHVGGFVLTRERLDETVPILNAAMEDRTNIEWDKDDIDALGILKVDVLALGMLSAIRKSFDLIARHYGQQYTLASVPTEDPTVYDMLSKADSIGVFQVESRAQMSMLPRLKPACFYDLVIEVAIVRPGPIQGDMVHPYLRRRDGLEPVSFPSPELEAVLAKTMGVPLFQEQAMQIAIVGAGFTPDEADKLRRAMATFRHVGTIHTFRDKFIDGMLTRGYTADFAERCFSQIEGFGEYGFPESHAASFALLVYVSSWIKRYYPDVFCAALVNSQPMGFYQPAQLVRDAREHGVCVLPPDVNASDWDCTLEPVGDAMPAPQPSEATPHETSKDPIGVPSRTSRASAMSRDLPPCGSSATGQVSGQAHVARPPGMQRESMDTRSRQPPRLAVRLGLRLVSGLQEAATKETVLAKRGEGYTDITSLWLRSQAPSTLLERLADADAFRSLGLDRRQALWAVKGLEGGALQAGHKRSGRARAPIFAQDKTGDLFAEAGVSLPDMSLPEHVVEDYSALGLSLKAHPVSFFRQRLKAKGVITSAEHWEERRAGRRATIAGLVLVRQRPGTAKGVIFLTVEDETGVVNVVVWPKMFEKFRRIVMGAQFLLVRGRIERHGLVIHIIAEDLVDLSRELATLSAGGALAHAGREVQEGSWRGKSRDFH